MAFIVRLVEVKHCCTRKRCEFIFKIKKKKKTESAVLNSAGDTSSQGEERESRGGLVRRGGGVEKKIRTDYRSDYVIIFLQFC